MTAYSVKVEPPGAFNGYRAVVDGPKGVRGTGYADSERRAVEIAFADLWDKAGL